MNKAVDALAIIWLFILWGVGALYVVGVLQFGTPPGLYQHLPCHYAHPIIGSAQCNPRLSARSR